MGQILQLTCSCHQHETQADQFFTDVFWNDYTNTLEENHLTFPLSNQQATKLYEKNSITIPYAQIELWIEKILDPQLLSQENQPTIFKVIKGPNNLIFNINNKFFLLEIEYDSIHLSGPLDKNSPQINHSKPILSSQDLFNHPEALYEKNKKLKTQLNKTDLENLSFKNNMQIKAEPFFLFFQDNFLKIKMLLDHCKTQKEDIFLICY